MKSIVTIIFSFLFVVFGFSQTRNVVVDTNGIVVQPTNIWTANATNARSGLGLGSAATNPASAFQPSSATLSNLASNNGASLTNIAVSNVVGALATNGNASALTSITAANIVGTVGLASNVSGTIAITNGGSGATSSGAARTNFGLVWSGLTNANASGFRSALELSASWLTNTNVTNFRTAIGLGATNNVTFADVDITGTLTMFGISGIVFDDPEAADVTRTNLGIGATWLTNTNTTNFRSAIGLGQSDNVSIGSDGGSLTTDDLIAANISVGGNVSFTNPATTRTNLGLGATWLTNTNVTNFRTAIGLGTNSQQQFSSMNIFDGTNSVFYAVSSVPILEVYAPIWFSSRTNDIFQFEEDASQAIARTNLGLVSTWLTNTNSPVFVNTNGVVISPTNFWQTAPIQTVVQTFAPITNTTNASTNARNLYVYSLATNITGVTNVITLPTNTSTFLGDNATIIHRGTTSSITAVRQAGASTNLITISNYDDAIKFIYENGSWDFYHNISFVEPIKFTDGNLEVNKAISRTNLGLPLQALTNTNAAGFQRAIFTTNSAPTNSANINTVNFNTAVAWMEVSVITNGVTNSYRIPLFQ